jgi:hypothetical protein
MDLTFDKSARLTLIIDKSRYSFDQDDLFGTPVSKSSISLQNALYLLVSFRFRPKEDGSLARNLDSDLSKIERFASLYDAFITSNYPVVATPPVRSVPRKVYTGAEEGFGERGDSAPHELSKIKRSDKRRWASINQELNKLGRTSGLFNRFDIKKLTQQDSGPFQVKVTVRGRSSAIADVGYGVSQSLPIFTDLITNKAERVALLLQQPEVHLHPRAQAELGTIFAQFVSNNSRGLIIAETHSDHLVDRIRIEVSEGRLNPSLVNIVFLCPTDDEVEVFQMGLDRQGNVLKAPAGYREFFIREQERLLGL